jgi:hypothetical protein
MRKGYLMFRTYQEKHKTYSIGLDPSLTGFGFVARPINHEEWYGLTYSTDAKDGTDTHRSQALAEAVIEDMKNLPYLPAVATIEDYGPMGRTAGKILPRAEMCGIIKHHVLTVLRIPLIMVAPNALKAAAMPDRQGKGFASKEEMMNAAHNQGYYAETDDEADAYFAAQVGTTLFYEGKTGCSYTRINPV